MMRPLTVRPVSRHRRSQRRSDALAVLLAVLVLLLAGGPAGAAGSLAVSEVRLAGFPRVLLRLDVLAPDGTPVPNLSGRHVTVRENGKAPRDVVMYPVAQKAEPLVLVLAVEGSAALEGEPLRQMQAAGAALLARLRSQDLATVIVLGAAPQPVPAVTDHRPALHRLLANVPAAGPAPRLYDGLYTAVIQAGAAGAPRSARAVVALTRGEDAGSTRRPEEVAQLAKELGVPLYLVLHAGEHSRTAEPSLEHLARESGGRLFSTTEAARLPELARRAGGQIYGRYELTYIADGIEPASEVHAQIRVTPPGVPPVETALVYRAPAVLAAIPAPPAPAVRLPEFTMPVEQRLALAALASGMALLGSGTALGLLYRRQSLSLLRRWVTPPRGPRTLRLAQYMRWRIMNPLVALVAGLAMRLLPERQLQDMQRQLELAGRPYGWAIQQFLFVRAVSAVLGGWLMYLVQREIPEFPPLLLPVAGAGLGYYLPQLWLRYKIRSRKDEILRELPDALDLLTISVQAGLGFDAALLEVVQKWNNELGREFDLVLQEMRLGMTRAEALRRLASRTGVQEVSVFVSAVLLSDELGTSIADTLSVQARQMRIRRRQRAEELAHQAAVKMLFPMIFLIFPALGIVILGPAVPSLLRLGEQLGP
jgi:tight adherence protein C